MGQISSETLQWHLQALKDTEIYWLPTLSDGQNQAFQILAMHFKQWQNGERAFKLSYEIASLHDLFGKGTNACIV